MGELVELKKAWGVMINKLEKQSKKWKSFGSRAKKAFIALVLGCLATALFTACIVVVAVGVSCASGGTAAAGAAIVAKTTTVFGVEVAKDCAIAAAVLGGAAVTLSVGLALAAPEMCSLSVLSTAQDIRKHLKEMIQLGKKTQEELDALHNKCGNVKKPYDYLVKNSPSRNPSKKHLRSCAALRTECTRD